MTPAQQRLSDLAAGHPEAMVGLREYQKFQNGIDNILAALMDSPGLPIECLSKEDQAKWTDIITGILMALGPYQASGEPLTVGEYLRGDK